MAAGPQPPGVVVGHELGLVGGHVDADRAVDLAALARQAQVERLLDRLRAPAAEVGVALKHLEQQPRPPPRGVPLLVGDHVAGAHRPAASLPTLADAERFKAVHYRKHVDLFEDGQFVVLDGDRVVAATSTIRLHFDFLHLDHTFGDIIQGGWLTSHQPAGRWLYGADIGVAPPYRGRGLGTALYAARQEAVWRFGLQGQVTAGMIRDYGTVSDRMSAEEYYQGVVDGRIKDSTLSMQLAVGFEPSATLDEIIESVISYEREEIRSEARSPLASVRNASK